MGMNTLQQGCSKITKLQEQDHLFFQDQDRLGQNQDQDRFFKDKTSKNVSLQKKSGQFCPVMPVLC